MLSFQRHGTWKHVLGKNGMTKTTTVGRRWVRRLVGMMQLQAEGKLTAWKWHRLRSGSFLMYKSREMT